MTRSTLELLDAWHAGDRDALTALIKLHARWLRSYVRRKMSRKMRIFETSEDVVQSVLLNLLRSGPTFRPANEMQFRALIARCVYNRLCELHDYSNAARRDPDCTEQAACASRVIVGASSSDQPERQASRAEERGLIVLAMQLIDPEDRRLIQWHDFEHLEFKLIAERLSRTVEGARSSYRRALARLRSQVERLRRGQLEDLVRDLDDDGTPDRATGARRSP